MNVPKIWSTTQMLHSNSWTGNLDLYFPLQKILQAKPKVSEFTKAQVASIIKMQQTLVISLTTSLHENNLMQLNKNISAANHLGSE